MLLKEGFDPMYGARPLRRTIQDKILDELSTQIIDNRLQEGDKIKAEMDNNGTVAFRKQDRGSSSKK